MGAMDGLSEHIAARREREKELAEFLGSLGAYTPTMPDQATKLLLERCGVSEGDERLIKLVSLAADKFAADMVQDALRYKKLRVGAQSDTEEEGFEKLEMADVAASLRERGIEMPLVVETEARVVEEEGEPDA